MKRTGWLFRSKPKYRVQRIERADGYVCFDFQQLESQGEFYLTCMGGSYQTFEAAKKHLEKVVEHEKNMKIISSKTVYP